MKKRLGRIIFWAGLPALWLVFRFGTVRTRVFVVVGDELLVLKNWIGSGKWSLPGGGLHLREDPAVGAARELAEEVGIKIKPSQLRLLTPQPINIRHGLSSFRCMAYQLKLSRKPQLVLQKREISQAEWMPIKQLPALDLGPSATQLLDTLGKG